MRVGRRSSSPIPSLAWTAISPRSRVCLKSRSVTARGSLSTMRMGSACSARKAEGLWPKVRCTRPHWVFYARWGKAAGVSGACVIAHETVIEWFVQRARPYIFTTASPPAVAHAVSASLKIIGGQEGDERRAHLGKVIPHTRAILQRNTLVPVDSHTAVQPLIIGGNEETLKLAAALDEYRMWVPAIRPPTVPVGTSRLRISLSAAHSHDDLAKLDDALQTLSNRP